MGAHSEPTFLPAVAANPTSPEIIPTPTREFSALRPSTQKSFGSLHHRFRHCLQIPLAPVQIPHLQTEKVPPLVEPIMSPLAPVSPRSSYSSPILPQPPSPSRIPSPQLLKSHTYLSQLPATILVLHFLPDEPFQMFIQVM